MSDEFEQQEWVKLGVAAALSRQYGEDQRNFLEMLADMLSSAMPGEVEIKRRGGLFSKKTLQSVTIVLGDQRYTMEDPGYGSLHASRTKIVRGIALKTEAMEVPDWLESLGASLEEKMRVSSTAREALSRLLGPPI